jgi:hypothetical protein
LYIDLAEEKGSPTRQTYIKTGGPSLSSDWGAILALTNSEISETACLYQLAILALTHKKVCFMNIAGNLYYVLRGMAFQLFSLSFHVRNEDIDPRLARLSRRVLRRDGWRCRGCDKKRTEVVLVVHRIRPGTRKLDEAVALCMPCKAVAEEKNLSGLDTPDFLRYLWCHLHNPEYALDLPSATIPGVQRSIDAISHYAIH